MDGDWIPPKNDYLWRIIPVIAIAALAIYRLVRWWKVIIVFDDLINIVIGFIALVVIIGTVYKDSREFKLNRKRKHLFPTLIVVVFIIGFLSSYLILKARDSGPVLIHASTSGDFNSCSIEFRKNGTYKFFESGGVGVGFFRGTYSIADSIIILDRNKIDKALETNRLVIRKNPHLDDGDMVCIYQVDARGQVRNDALSFIVREDNR
jgi:hypothetical protein